MKEFVIIGNSAAGISAVEAIRKEDKQSKILVISDEDYSAYCRCLISYYLAGEIKEEKILYRPQSFYKDNNVELILNKKVTRVDPKKNRIVCEDKKQFNYDALLIASGGRPKFPEIKGIKKGGVFGFRTIKDAKEIEGLLPVTKTVCVLGGGLIGLKAAYALRRRNIEVKVVVKSGQVLSQMLDAQAANFIQNRLAEHGIEVITGTDVAEVIGNGDIKAVKLDSGKAFGCSLIIVAKGVSPNVELVRDTEIKIKDGIIADNFMQTNIPNIYAAGDVSETFDLALEEISSNALWPTAIEQGKVAGANMSGAKLNYPGSLGMNSLEFFGLPVISLGVYKIKAGDSSYEVLKYQDEKENVYKKLVLKDNYLKGAVMVGDVKNSGIFLRLIREKINLAPLRDQLLETNFGYPQIMDLVRDTEKMYL